MLCKLVGWSLQLKQGEDLWLSSQGSILKFMWHNYFFFFVMHSGGFHQILCTDCFYSLLQHYIGLFVCLFVYFCCFWCFRLAAHQIKKPWASGFCWTTFSNTRKLSQTVTSSCFHWKYKHTSFYTFSLNWNLNYQWNRWHFTFFMFFNLLYNFFSTSNIPIGPDSLPIHILCTALLRSPLFDGI